MVFSLLASVAFAAGPEWSSGFPKLSKKNALLQWAPVKGAEEYKVYRGESKGVLKVIATVKVNRYIDKDLAPGKTFLYAVTAVSGGKEGERSSEGKVTTASEKVFVPLKAPKLIGSHIKEQAGGKSIIAIRWEGAAGTDLVGVNVYKSKAKGKDYALVGSSQSDTFEDKDVQPGSTYYYVVTAVDNQFNETKYSNELEVKMPVPEKEAAKESKTLELVTMRPAKFLFRIPREQGGRKDDLIPGNAQGVAVDEAVGHIYVTSYGYGGILVYDMEGKLQFGIRKDGVGGEARFDSPKTVRVGSRGDIYMTDYYTPDINVFNFAGKPTGTIGVDVTDITHGPKAKLYGLDMDKEGNIYVTDPISNTIQSLTPRGKRRFYIIGGRTEAEVDKAKGKQLYNGPSRLTVTGEGDIVFVDAGYQKLMVYGPDGKFKRSIGKFGPNVGELYYPTGICDGDKGELLVASGESANIQAFSPDGKFLYALSNEKGDGPLDVSTMRDIFVDGKKRLYVAEGVNNRISVFQLEDRTIEVIPQK